MFVRSLEDVRFTDGRLQFAGKKRGRCGLEFVTGALVGLEVDTCYFLGC